MNNANDSNSWQQQRGRKGGLNAIFISYYPATLHADLSHIAKRIATG